MPLYERYEGVTLAFVRKTVSSSLMKGKGADSFRGLFYPTDYRTKSSAPLTINGQRSGSCQFRSIYSYFLHKLGRSLALKVKIAMQTGMLKEVYRSLDSLQPGSRQSLRITIAGKTFYSAHYGVWKFLRQTGLVERKLLRQVMRHVDDASMVDPTAVVDACTKHLRDHCQSSSIPQYQLWPEWSPNKLMESWIQPNIPMSPLSESLIQAHVSQDEAKSPLKKKLREGAGLLKAAGARAYRAVFGQ